MRSACRRDVHRGPEHDVITNARVADPPNRQHTHATWKPTTPVSPHAARRVGRQRTRAEPMLAPDPRRSPKQRTTSVAVPPQLGWTQLGAGAHRTLASTATTPSSDTMTGLRSISLISGSLVGEARYPHDHVLERPRTSRAGEPRSAEEQRRRPHRFAPGRTRSRRSRAGFATRGSVSSCRRHRTETEQQQRAE